MLTRDEWMASQGERPPFGLLPVAGREAAIRWHTTSGTTGREPIRVLDTAKDWAWQAEMWCYGLWGFGVRPADTAYVAFGYGSFIGFWGLHYGMEKMGVLNVPGGAQTTEGRVRQLVDFGATVVASTPTYALRLAQEAERLGVDLAAGGVKRLILSGEPAGSIPQTKALIERLWGAKGGRHRRHDRDRHHHDLRVPPPAGRHPHHRGPLHRGGRRPGQRRAGRLRRGGGAGGDLLRPRHHPAAALPHRRPGDQGAGLALSLRARLRPVRGRHPGPGRRHEAGPGDQRVPAGGRGDRPRVPGGGGVPAPADPRGPLRPDRPAGRARPRHHRRDLGRHGRRLAKALAEAHEGLRFEVERAREGELPRFELKARRTVDRRDTPIGG
jgi:phenylacetate-CoA ligase